MIRNLEIGKRLMLITHRTEHYTEYEEAEMFLQGGGRWVQLRMKQGLDLEMAKRIAALCAKYDALFCIDDNVQIALACSASAVHLGKNDMPIAEAKAIVEAANPEKPFWIGATANTFEDIQNATRQGASYIGLGPFRFTQTKQKLSPVLGLDGYKHIVGKCADEGIMLPIYAIGGITEEDIPDLMRTGITGIAVSGTIVQAENPIEETQRLLQLVASHIQK